ncbi:NirA family protein [Labrys neptuniae]
MGQDFNPEQKRWLEGFLSGATAARSVAAPPAASPAPAGSSGPDAEQAAAQERVLAEGGKLVDQEKWKRAENPLDAYARLRQEAISGAKPKPEDNFRWRYHGLFYVAPAQDSYMCRLRIPNGILRHWQLAGIADIAERLGGGYAHVTTRANLQIREIPPACGPAVVEGLAELGIIVKGAGADNIRNVTGAATAGIDPAELLDTRPHARAWHHHILNCRAMAGLPRKFNVSFDGGGTIPTLEETNDIAFQAVLLERDGEARVLYRLALGGITGHKDFARDTGVVIAPDEAVQLADAIVRVYAAHGDRTNRNRARLKYLLDDWGFERFIAAVEDKFGARLERVSVGELRPHPGHDRLAHVGVHAQRQHGLNWIGLALPAGKLTADEMRALADLAADLGDGDIRLTVWQNLLISGVPDEALAQAKARIEACGLHWTTSVLRAGLVACTGNRGCKFAASDTKGHALAIADHVDARLALDQPVNIHLTGCHHSCAQHYIGDIGLIGAKVAVGEADDQVEGYHLHVGGGFGSKAAIGRLLYADVTADAVPARVEALLRAYLGHRSDAEESFAAFAARTDVETLKQLAEASAT